MFEKNPYFGVGAPTLPLDGDLLLIAVLVIVALLMVLVLRGAMGQHARRTASSLTIDVPSPPEKRTKPILHKGLMRFPERQLQVVAEVGFETRPLLNRSEQRLLPVLDAAVARHGRGHRVMAQTSMGEVLRPKPGTANDDVTNAAYAAINSKRFDFTIVDAEGQLMAAIEYQGSGHYGREAFMRDAVKREVCRKAGVAYLEVRKGMRPAELAAELDRILAGQSQSIAPTSPP